MPRSEDIDSICMGDFVGGRVCDGTVVGVLDIEKVGYYNWYFW